MAGFSSKISGENCKYRFLEENGGLPAQIAPFYGMNALRKGIFVLWKSGLVVNKSVVVSKQFCIDHKKPDFLLIPDHDSPILVRFGACEGLMCNKKARCRTE